MHFAGNFRKQFQILTSVLLSYTISCKNPVATTRYHSILGSKSYDFCNVFSYMKNDTGLQSLTLPEYYKKNAEFIPWNVCLIFFHVQYPQRFFLQNKR